MRLSHKIFEPVESILSLDKLKKGALTRLAIENVIDLLLYRPISYRNRRLNPGLQNLVHGEEIVTKIEVKSVEYPIRKSMPVKVFASNETGGITIVFFKFHGYLKTLFKVGSKLTIAGKVEFFDYRPQINHPEIIFGDQLATVSEPKYALTYGLTNSQLRSYIYKAISYIKNIPEWLPGNIINEYKLPTFQDSIKILHCGKSTPLLERALERLKIDEALSNQLSFRYLKEQNLSKKGRFFQMNGDLKQKVIDRLGFDLTIDQKLAIEEIEKEQTSDRQMLRMVQGDVGCGKTIVAILTALNVIGNNAQVALMVPTEVLAQQHYNFSKKILNELSINVQLLTGKITGKAKKEVLASIEGGEANLIIGTHSLFQESVKFRDLGYIIVDEQHRFGVNQRMELISKGTHPDVLVMSATPIPRSLSLAMFGDLSISSIKTMPKCRKPIKTLVAPLSKLEDVYSAIKNRIEKNEKFFWVCPLIENQSENDLAYTDIETRFSYLSSIFGNKVEALHGLMFGDEKNNIINRLSNGDINILVATTVIEVGIDIPSATMMIVENAEKFGLAQLHQLRGRVGRGDKESICILLYGKYATKVAFERMKIMRQSQDGFYIAEQDLLLRGEGELLGEKQSGEQNFKFIDLSQDGEIINKCNIISKTLEIDNNRLLQISIYNKSVITNSIVA